MPLASEAVHETLAAWGLPANVVGPEVSEVLAQPIDAARIGQWVAEFHPAGDVKAQWEASQAALADRKMPAAAPGLRPLRCSASSAAWPVCRLARA